MLNTALFFGWVAIAVLVIRYRVHVHVEIAGGARRKRKPRATGIRAVGDPNRDLVSALVNLGCSKVQAKAAVARAVSQGPGEFEELLRRSIREAA